ncbi:6771_t:CDS:1, partial [Racocetra persica]
YIEESFINSDYTTNWNKLDKQLDLLEYKAIPSKYKPLTTQKQDIYNKISVLIKSNKLTTLSTEHKQAYLVYCIRNNDSIKYQQK